jgi:hypothetical protein
MFFAERRKKIAMTIITTELSETEFRSLMESEAKFLSNYSVGFVTPSGGDDYGIGGSGTLVSIDNVKGILTAAHVVEHLRAHADDIGLVLPIPGLPHRPKMHLDHCRVVAIGPGSTESSGPDIAFIQPPLDLLGTLAARQSFYNLSKRTGRMLSEPINTELGWWLLSGFAGEWTTDLSPQFGYQRLKSFRGMHGLGHVEKYSSSTDGHDYLTFQALYNERYQGPQDFGGFNGGALWQLLGQEVDGRIEVVEHQLTGVAFFESAKSAAVSPTRDIICHGPVSVYGKLLGVISCE